MEPKTEDFDSNRGETQKVEPLLNIKEFCRNRMDEILMLTESLSESPFRGQAFQRLPKHMRRRQMSHHIKRLPQSIRKNYMGSPKDDVISLSKCPSRKYRRRPQNLLNEYNRRQKTNIWLETHIWHSKRFHMISKWGYKLPDKPTNKSFRACYRAAKKHCLLNDISFYNCIELNGFERKILDGLQKCVSPDIGLTFASKMFIKGYREGTIMLFHPLCYPYQAIGQISFLWKPFKGEEKYRTIWIFTHPLYHHEIIEMFKDLFQLNESLPGIIQMEREKIEKKGEKDKLKRRDISCKENMKFINEDGTFSMILLKDQINRFRLTGPLSLSIIANAFDMEIPVKASQPQSQSQFQSQPQTEIEIEIEIKKEKNEMKGNKRRHSEIFESCSGVGNKPAEKMETNENREIIISEGIEWWYRYYGNEFSKNCFENQKKFYEELKNYFSPSDLPSGMVFSVVVKDPRLTLPNKRIKSLPQINSVNSVNSVNSINEDEQVLLSIDDSLSDSPFWDSNIREEISSIKLPTALINSFRSNLIIPGSDLGKFFKENNQAKIPLLIIQRPPQTTSTCYNTDFGSGFDILVPSGWAMPVWLSLIYRGARSGGLRENEALIAHSKNLTQFFQPDSNPGEKENLDKFKYLKMCYFKRPPNKRPNFVKIGVESPFYFPWEILINEWRLRSVTSRPEPSKKVQFFVLRNRKTLSDLNNLLGNLMKMLNSKKKFDFNIDFKEEELDCLVPVTVESRGKGTPKEYAMICIPHDDDVKGLNCPVEPSHSDGNEKIRKNLKFEHLKMLKSLRRKSKKEKMKRNKKQFKNEEREISSKDIVYKYREKRESLWLKEPENINSLIDTCSRTILGYIILGGFNYVKGQALGSGYVTLRGLLYFLKNCYNKSLFPFVLFRNSNSINYKFAYLTICMN